MVQKHNISFGEYGRLSGRLSLPDRKERVPGAILCHGLGSGLETVRPSALSLAKQGIASFIFDFRGHGRSKGVFDGRQVEDVVEAWQWLTRFEGVDKTRIALIGHSMGAAAAIIATRDIGSPRAIVALACPPDTDEKYMPGTRFDLRQWLGKEDTLLEYPKDGTLPWLSGFHAVVAWGWMYLRGYRLLINWEKFFSRFPNMKISHALQTLSGCPKLFVHCQGDRRISHEATIKLYQKAPEPKDLLLANGCFHAAPLVPGKLRQKWISWVVTHLATESEG